ncbi:MAG: 4-hydroxy-3-methylbut-2-enyl diphosphate reductase [Selenomonadaceae bacterium]|nr:4-hydroxy-3-methylbut-2-enyl diphosphate reductase [Selenomonadaceae bacterium]MBR3723421.1 4-hydroxy-3-methylbut-2-enyl diphosphate reductase [Selenomonadaceae bacterium]
MEVLLADYLGFCYGVKRAIKIAKEHVSTKDNPAATLGPIIHNPQMVERLKNDGVGAINSLDEMDKGTVIIRSHGVGPVVYDEAEQKGLAVVDATCPHVRRAQLAAKDLVKEGYSVVIIGEKNHPEVKSIFEWTNGSAVITQTVEEAEAVPPAAKLGIVSQTTFSGENFKAIVLKLLDKSQELKIERTICTATDQRQKAAMDLASKVDLMLVIGGKNSANTTRLYQLCAEKCTTYHIETAKELESRWFDNVNKIGITAGASTPDWIIKEVYEQCQKR